MERQNVTLSLPKALLKKAKTIASQQDKSLSELLRQSIEEKVQEASGFRKARERQILLLRSELDLGTRGKLTTTREDIHERR